MIDQQLEMETRLIPWDDKSRAALHDFLCEIANTRVKVKVLELFLSEPYLCLSSDRLAERVGEDLAQVRESARQLHKSDALLYCESFGYADICCLSFQHHAPIIQRYLCLLRMALRSEPQAVWSQVV